MQTLSQVFNAIFPGCQIDSIQEDELFVQFNYTQGGQQYFVRLRTDTEHLISGRIKDGKGYASGLSITTITQLLESIKWYQQHKEERKIIVLNTGEYVFIPVKNTNYWKLCFNGILEDKLYTRADIDTLYIGKGCILSCEVSAKDFNSFMMGIFIHK